MGEKQILNAKLASLILDAANLGREVTRLCPFWGLQASLTLPGTTTCVPLTVRRGLENVALKNATLLSLLKILGNVIPGPMAMDTVPQKMQRRTAEIQNQDEEK